MTSLVADIGGTNSRLALVGRDQSVCSVRRFANADYASFFDILDAYASGASIGTLAGVCIAVAGPVTSGVAELTNRNWTIAADNVSRALGLADGRPVKLINDLVALGHALPVLNSEQVSDLVPGRVAALNDQALVAGVGTGFNICVAKTGKVPSVLEAEVGHASLPFSVWQTLADAIGDGPARQFDSIEMLFSGRGFSAIYAALSESIKKDGAEILAAYAAGSDQTARDCTELLAQLMGRLARELVFQYLPLGGIHFAGGVARGVLGSPARTAFIEGLNAPGLFSDLVSQVPVRLITDDAAALTGIAQLVSES